MIEVLVTIVILAIGLLGLMNMQGRLQRSEVESYQRTQALMLLQDMASRIEVNRADTSSYVIGDPNDPASIGSGSTCPTAVATLQERDRKEWCEALQGAGETEGGTNVGAMIGGRGCVYELFGGAEYQVTVAWQGLGPISSPSVICGKGNYDAAGTECINDLCRRSVTTIVRLGDLPP
jgi:type IV pilus assembly protein PilV